MKGSQLGYILNSDMTVTSSKQSGKTPIGVVVCSYSGGGGQAMSLKSLGDYAWGQFGTNISTLKDYPDSASAYKDTSSYANTAKIIEAGDKSKYPAAWAAHEYSTEGTSAGDWCLPAAGILTSYYANKREINKGFNRAGGTNFSVPPAAWSSSEDDYTKAWYSLFDKRHGLLDQSKYMGFRVIPVIGFCDAGYEYDKTTDSCKIRNCGGYSKSLQPECIEYDTCQSGSTTYYSCKKCNPCSMMCGSECVKGYEDINKIGKYATYTTCTYNGKNYYTATSCDESYFGNRLDELRGYCYQSDGDNAPFC